MNDGTLTVRLPAIPLRPSIALFVAMIVAVMLAYWATPHLEEVTDAPNLEETVPRQFGDWRELPTPYAQVSLSTGTDPNMDSPYDQTIMRTYVNSNGQQVMLALAWGKRQRQEVKIHRPDLCYVAQGFKVVSLLAQEFEFIRTPNNISVTGKHMYTQTAQFGEAVSYWMRIGTIYSEDAIDTRYEIFRQGLRGQIPDGILVRASIRGPEDAQHKLFKTLDNFLLQLYDASPPNLRTLMVR
jgi:EpsI family protein